MAAEDTELLFKVIHVQDTCKFIDFVFSYVVASPDPRIKLSNMADQINPWSFRSAA